MANPTNKTETKIETEIDSEKEKSSEPCIPVRGKSTSIDANIRTSIAGSSSVKSSFSGNVSDMESITPDSKFKSFKNERVRCCESGKSSMSLGSNSTASICSNFSKLRNKPHKSNDPQWDAIQYVKAKDGDLGASHFRLLKQLGRGDIGEVKLAQLRGTKCFFAVKIVDKEFLGRKSKLVRAQTEREILSCLDHPFLPTLYTHYETEKYSYLVMEFCSGGDLHMLRQLQPGRRFSESAARFYASEVLLALEYLHMMGIIYRDLKPENVLVREEGHIMLLDFDLSLRCIVSPTVVKSASSISSVEPWRRESVYRVQPSCMEPACATATPVCARPTCFMPAFLSHKSKKARQPKTNGKQVEEVIVEPTSARSMSFVGTHEYLAPEILKEEGHGSAVDWWTFGIFVYELLYGKTPFKGVDNTETLANVVGKPLKFPQNPSVSFAARDLIGGLLLKDPQHRLGCKRGAAGIKQHPFFQGTNWALIRCTTPQIPKPLDLDFLMNKDVPAAADAEEQTLDSDAKSSESYVEFEFF